MRAACTVRDALCYARCVQVSGSVRYNGVDPREFFIRRTAGLVDQRESPEREQAGGRLFCVAQSCRPGTQKPGRGQEGACLAARMWALLAPGGVGDLA